MALIGFSYWTIRGWDYDGWANGPEQGVALSSASRPAADGAVRGLPPASNDGPRPGFVSQEGGQRPAAAEATNRRQGDPDEIRLERQKNAPDESDETGCNGCPRHRDGGLPMGGLDLAPGCYPCCEWNFFLMTSVERLSSAARMSRLLLTAPDLRRSTWMMHGPAFLRCARRMSACDAMSFDAQLTSTTRPFLEPRRSAQAWKPMQSSIRKQPEFSGLA